MSPAIALRHPQTLVGIDGRWRGVVCSWIPRSRDLHNHVPRFPTGSTISWERTVSAKGEACGDGKDPPARVQPARDVSAGPPEKRSATGSHKRDAAPHQLDCGNSRRARSGRGVEDYAAVVADGIEPALRLLRAAAVRMRPKSQLPRLLRADGRFPLQSSPDIDVGF
jgi:hypothetical protein